MKHHFACYLFDMAVALNAMRPNQAMEISGISGISGNSDNHS